MEKNMKVDVFPGVYEQSIVQHMEQEKSTEELKTQNRIHSLEQQVKDLEQQSKNAEIATTHNGSIFGLLGAGVAFFARWGCAGGMRDIWSVLDVLLSSLIIGGIVFFLGSILGKMMGRKSEGQVKERIKQDYSVFNTLISQENTDLENRKRQIEQTGMQQIAQYKKEFDEQAKKLSVSYANSKLAQDVISWMTEGYSKRIVAVDRKSYTKMIEVPYGIKVYTNKITCNQGEYDFYIHRCKNLETPLDQTALARAISNAIRLNIMMKFPKDPSGTKPEIKIKVKYTEQYPEVNLIYIAPNGKYVPTSGWK